LSWSAAFIADLIERKAAVMTALEQDDSVLFPGAAAAIRSTASVMPIAIASGALSAEVRRVLDHASLTQHFSAIVTAEDTPASKPAPDPYRRAVTLLSAVHGQLEPSQCVAVEDSRWGLESARAAGLRTVAVAQTYPASELGPADVVIASMLEFDIAILTKRLGADGGKA